MYSPGPWQTSREGASKTLIVKDATGLPLLRMYAGRNEDANAALVAAASDLLAALKGVLRESDRCTDAYAAAHRAIAKATAI